MSLISLSSASTFGLFGASITNSGPSIISGDVGVYLGLNNFVGLPPGIVAGNTQLNNCEAGIAQVAILNAYNALTSTTCTQALTGNLGAGQTLPAGVYCLAANTLLTGVLTLNGQSNANAVFIFKITGTLTTAAFSSIVLTNGAVACNVFFQVTSSASLGNNSTFAGTLIANGAITTATSTFVNGRLLSLSGNVALVNTILYAPTCPLVSQTAPVLTLVATMTTPTSLGSNFAYNLIIDNTLSTSPLTNVVLNDVIPPNLIIFSDSINYANYFIPIIPAGTILSRTIKVQAISVGVSSNSFTFYSNQFPLGLISNSVSTTVVSSISTPVVLNTKVSAFQSKIGNAFTYTLTVSNNGLVNQTNVVLTDVLPTNVSVVPNGTNPLVITIPLIAAGTSVVQTVEVTGTAEGIANNSFAITSTQIVVPLVSNVVTTLIVSTPVNVSLYKYVDNIQTVLGSIINYTLVVDNSGVDAYPLTNVVLTDILPVSLSPALGGSNTVYFTVPLIPAGAITIYKLAATSLLTGTISNFFTLISDQFPSPFASNTVISLVTATKVGVTVLKTASVSTVNVGTPFTYTLSIDNSQVGAVTLSNVNIVDLLPSNVTLVTPSAAPYTVVVPSIVAGTVYTTTIPVVASAFGLAANSFNYTNTGNLFLVSSNVSVVLVNPALATPSIFFKESKKCDKIIKFKTVVTNGIGAVLIPTGTISYQITKVGVSAPVPAFNETVIVPLNNGFSELIINTKYFLRGDYSIVAVYSGDALNNTVTSETLYFRVKSC